MDLTLYKRIAATTLAVLGGLTATVLTVGALFLAIARPAVAQLMLSAMMGSFLWTAIATFGIAALLWALVAWWAHARRYAATRLLTTVAAILATVGAIATYAHRSLSYARSVVYFDASDGVRLGATLYVPRKAGPHPAIVIAAGAGSNPRELYDLYADHFARLGYLVLNPDKRGVGISGGNWSDIDDSEANTMSHIVDVRARDVASAVEALRIRSDVRADSIGLFAASQGGWVAPVAAAQNGKIAFMILQSTPTVTSAEEHLWGELTGEEADHFGFLPPRIAFDEVERQLDTMSVRDGFDPKPYWRAVRIPSLWLFGEWDKSIPALRSARQVQEWRASGAPFDVIVFREANHGLMIARGPRKKRLAYPAPELWTSIDQWLAGRGVK